VLIGIVFEEIPFQILCPFLNETPYFVVVVALP
jgi:hypothetical protein